jgi:hypothetical protein
MLSLFNSKRDCANNYFYNSRAVTFLFWNLNGKPLQNLVADLLQEHGVDVLLLVEDEIPKFLCGRSFCPAFVTKK